MKAISKNILKKGLRSTSIVYLLLHLSMMLIGFTLVLQNEESAALLWPNVGFALLGTGVCGLVVFIYISVSDERNKINEIVKEFGISNIFSSRSVTIKSEYDTRLTNLKQQLDILAYGLQNFNNDHVQNGNLEKWASKVKIRILLVDPDSGYAGKRDLEENNFKDRISLDINHFLENTKHIREKHGDNLKIRLSKVMPSTNIFRIDGQMFFGPYFAGEASQNAPTFLVNEGGVLFSRYLKHFDTIWGDENFSRSAEEYEQNKN